MKNSALKYTTVLVAVFIANIAFAQCIPAPDAGPNDTIDCNHPSVQLTATGGATYVWTPELGLDDDSIATPIATPTVTTTYKVVATTGIGCVDSATVTVFVNKDEPIVYAGNDTSITCISSSSIQLAGTGGSNLATYLWSNSSSLDDANLLNPTASPTMTTTYNLTITDTNGCFASDEVTITVDKDEPIPNAGNDTSITCITTPTIQLNGTGGVSYAWSPSPNLSDTSIHNPIASPTTTDTFYLYVTGPNGCTSSTPDEVIVVVDIEAPLVDAGLDDTINCINLSVPLNVSEPGTYSWSPTTGLNDPTISNPIATPTSNQEYVVTVTANNGCIGSDNVKVIIDNDPPNANAGPDFGTTCAALNAQLLGSGGVEYSWSPTTALSDPNISNPFASPFSTTTYTLTVTGANGCTDTDQTIVTLNDITPFANAGSDIEECGIYSVSLNADVSNNLNTDFYTWSAHPSNPTLATFSNLNNPTATVGNLQEGIYTFFWTVSNNVCPPVQDTMLVKIYDEPIADAGMDDSICASDNVNLRAGLPAGTSTGEWTVENGFPNPSSVIFADSSIHNTNVSGLEEGVYHFIWTVSNGTCLDDKDTVEISVFNQPISIAGSDNSLCNIYTDDLAGVAPLGTAQGFWYEDLNNNHPSSVLFSDTANPSSNISGLQEGTYQLIWETYNGNCPVDRDTVLITIYDSPIANAGVNQSVCGVDSLNTDTLLFLMANQPLGTSTGNWSVDLSFTNPSVPEFINSSAPNSSVTNLKEGVSQFIWTVSNGTCTDATDVIQITAYDSPFSKAGLDKEICGENEVEMTASQPIGTSEGLWSIDTSFNNPSLISFDNVNSPTSNSTGYLEGVYQLIWTVSNSNCDPKNDTVKVTIYDEPVANAGQDIAVCDTFKISFLAIDPMGTASGVWELDNNFLNPTTIILLDDTLNNTQGSGYIEGTYQFVWKVSNGVCEDDYDTVQIINYNQPFANAGEDQILCELDTVQLNGGGNVGTAIGRWEIDTAYNNYSSIPTFRDSSDSNSMADNFMVGNYPLIFLVENGVCPTSYDTMLVINQPKPVAAWEFPTEACDNKCFDVISLSTPPSGLNIMVDWTIDDQNYTDSVSEVCLYEVGKSSIKLIVTASNGCKDSLVEADTIIVNPAPIANFDMFFNNDSLLELQRLDVLSTASTDVIDFQYSLGNGDTLFDEDLIYIYKEFGNYEITQWVENQYGCRDSITKGRRVGKRRTLYIPNSFTPNGDGINDLFGPVSRDLSDDFYEFTIANRLGKTFFKSNTVDEKWDGTINGKLVQDGTFIWSLTYLFKGEIEVMNKEGHVVVAK